MADAKKSGGKVEAVVLFDGYRYHEKTGDFDSPIVDAHKGDKITVSAAEFERGVAMGGLAKAGDKDAQAPVEVPSDLSELSDAELQAIASSRGATNVDKLTRDELVGIVAASPGGNERPQD